MDEATIQEIMQRFKFALMERDWELPLNDQELRELILEEYSQSKQEEDHQHLQWLIENKKKNKKSKSGK